MRYMRISSAGTRPGMKIAAVAGIMALLSIDMPALMLKWKTVPCGA
jgi:hypothetical protein